MSEEVTCSGELLPRVQKLEDKLKDSERKRMDLIQSNAALQKILKACWEQDEQKRMDLIQSKPALQKILKACREQEIMAQQEIVSLWERLVSLKMRKVEGLGHQTTITNATWAALGPLP